MKKNLKIIGLLITAVIILLGAFVYSNKTKLNQASSDIKNVGLAKNNHLVPPNMIGNIPGASAATENLVGKWEITRCRVVKVTNDGGPIAEQFSEVADLGPAEWEVQYTIDGNNYQEKWKVPEGGWSNSLSPGSVYSVTYSNRNGTCATPSYNFSATGNRIYSSGLYGWSSSGDWLAVQIGGSSTPRKWEIYEVTP